MSEKIKKLLKDGLYALKKIEETYPDSIKNIVNNGYIYNPNTINSNSKEDNYKILKFVYSKILIYLILSNSVVVQNDVFVLNGESYKYNKDTITQNLKVYNTFSETTKKKLNGLIDKNIDNVKVNIENASTGTGTGTGGNTNNASAGTSAANSIDKSSSGLDENELKKSIKFILNKLNEEYSLSKLSTLPADKGEYDASTIALTTYLGQKATYLNLLNDNKPIFALYDKLVEIQNLHYKIFITIESLLDNAANNANGINSITHSVAGVAGVDAIKNNKGQVKTPAVKPVKPVVGQSELPLDGLNTAKNALISSLSTDTGAFRLALNNSLTKVTQLITKLHDYQTNKKIMTKRIDYKNLVLKKLNRNEPESTVITDFNTNNKNADVDALKNNLNLYLTTTHNNNIGSHSGLIETNIYAFNITIKQIHDLKMLFNALQIKCIPLDVANNNVKNLIRNFRRLLNDIIKLANLRRQNAAKYICPYRVDSAVPVNAGPSPGNPGSAPPTGQRNSELNNNNPYIFKDIGHGATVVANAGAGAGASGADNLAYNLQPSDLVSVYNAFAVHHNKHHVIAYEQIVLNHNNISFFKMNDNELIKYNIKVVVNLIISSINDYSYLTLDQILRLNILLESPIISSNYLYLYNLIYYYKRDQYVITSLLNIEDNPSSLLADANFANTYNTAYDAAYGELGNIVDEIQSKGTIETAITTQQGDLSTLNENLKSTQAAIVAGGGGGGGGALIGPATFAEHITDIREKERAVQTELQKLDNCRKLARNVQDIDITNLNDKELVHQGRIKDVHNLKTETTKFVTAYDVVGLDHTTIPGQVNPTWYSKSTCVQLYHDPVNKSTLFRDYLNEYARKNKELQELEDIKKQYEAELKNLLGNKSSSSNKTSSKSTLESGSYNTSYTTQGSSSYNKSSYNTSSYTTPGSYNTSSYTTPGSYNTSSYTTPGSYNTSYTGST